MEGKNAPFLYYYKYFSAWEESLEGQNEMEWGRERRRTQTTISQKHHTMIFPMFWLWFPAWARLRAWLTLERASLCSVYLAREFGLAAVQPRLREISSPYHASCSSHPNRALWICTSKIADTNLKGPVKANQARKGLWIWPMLAPMVSPPTQGQFASVKPSPISHAGLPWLTYTYWRWTLTQHREANIRLRTGLPNSWVGSNMSYGIFVTLQGWCKGLVLGQVWLRIVLLVKYSNEVGMKWKF